MALSEIPSQTPPYFTDDMHALHAGLLIGAMLKSDFQIILEQDDEGNYTGVIEVSLPTWEEGLEPIRVKVQVLA